MVVALGSPVPALFSAPVVTLVFRRAKSPRRRQCKAVGVEEVVPLVILFGLIDQRPLITAEFLTCQLCQEFIGLVAVPLHLFPDRGRPDEILSGDRTLWNDIVRDVVLDNRRPGVQPG